MADTFSKEKRSWIMSRIRAKDTTPEMHVRQFLFRQGYRYRLHVKTLPGKPDIVLKKCETVIFVHGCFWHGHQECKKASLPKTHTEWWKDKMTYNTDKDRRNQSSLEKSGWKVFVIWQCELTSTKSQLTLNRLLEYLRRNKG